MKNMMEYDFWANPGVILGIAFTIIMIIIIVGTIVHSKKRKELLADAREKVEGQYHEEAGRFPDMKVVEEESDTPPYKPEPIVKKAAIPKTGKKTSRPAKRSRPKA